MQKKIKIAVGLLIGFIVFTILHNAFYTIFRIEEPIFFILALLSGFGFVISLIYLIITSAAKIIKKSAKKK